MDEKEMLLIKKLINLFDLNDKEDYEFDFIKGFKSNKEFFLRIREIGIWRCECANKTRRYINKEWVIRDAGKAIRALYKYAIFFKK